MIEAERLAKADLIRRQEETAATRSLLNTARLTENNPLLLRLKEIETLEKLVEKVGRIDLTSPALDKGSMLCRVGSCGWARTRTRPRTLSQAYFQVKRTSAGPDRQKNSRSR